MSAYRQVALGLLAALVAAVAGGVAWSLVVKWTDYEIGILALAIGFLAGTAAALVAAEARGLPLQAGAVIASLVGILVGKYLTYYWAQVELGDRFGLEVVDFYSSAMLRAFREELDVVFGWFDLLWAGLAAFTAWRATAPPPVEPAEPATPAV